MNKEQLIKERSQQLLDTDTLENDYLNTGTTYLFNDFETGEGRELRQKFIEGVPIDHLSQVVTDEATLLLSDPTIVRTKLNSDVSEKEIITLLTEKIEQDSTLKSATGTELEEDYEYELNDLIQEVAIGLYYNKQYTYELEFVHDENEFASLVADNLHDKVIEPSIEILTAHLHERLGRRSFQEEVKNELTSSEKSAIIEFSEMVDQLAEGGFAEQAIANGSIDRNDLRSQKFIDHFVDRIDFRFSPKKLLLELGRTLYNELLKNEKLALIDLSNDQDPFDLESLSYLDVVIPSVIKHNDDYNYEITDINIDPEELIEWEQ